MHDIISRVGPSLLQRAVRRCNLLLMTRLQFPRTRATMCGVFRGIAVPIRYAMVMVGSVALGSASVVRDAYGVGVRLGADRVLGGRS
jgi:hypothetical protein